MTGNIVAPSGAREISIEATVIRADGRVEPLGRVAYWHKSRARRALWHLGRIVRRIGGALGAAIRA
ncbi:MAG: hypothetical protein AB7O45_10595 [Alphaproteobacteria bacterium]